MAQLKDLIVNGASQLIGDVYTSQIQISKLNALTASNSTTYSGGSAGQILMSNGTNTYWGNITAGAGGNAKIFYGTCSTAAATTAKEVTCADFTSADLVKGAIIYVTFTIKNTGTQSSLTLNVNSTGGKPIKHLRNGSIYNIPGAGYLLADQTYRFTYDGTNWVTDMEYDSENSLQRTYRSSTNVELPIAAISTAGSTTAAYSAISSGSYKDVYAAIPDTDANRVMFNPSTGLITFGQNGLKTNKIQAPTTAGGTTYGAGSSWQALLSNGTTVYWGVPTFNQTLNLYAKDASNTAKSFVEIYARNYLGNISGQAVYTVGSTTTITAGQWQFREYSPNSPASATSTGKYEQYSLPNVTSGLSASQYYDILTTKLHFTNITVATSTWAASTTYSGFSWKADITCNGVSANHVPNVIFDYNELISGNFCPFADSGSNKVTIYCKTKPTGTITIPTIYCT